MKRRAGLLWQFIQTFVTLFVILLAAYIVVFDGPWLSYENLPFKVLKHEVKPGELVPLIVTRCSSLTHKRSYIVTHQLTSMDGYPPKILPGESVLIDPGCAPIESHANMVPVGTENGHWFFEGTGEIRGLFTSYSVPWHSEILVVKRDE